MIRPTHGGLRHALLVITLFALPALRATTRPVSFDRDIQPILAENCYHCHGPDAEKRKARFRLDQRDDAFAGGKSGLAAIVPGKPDDSELILRVFAHAEEDIMPTPESNRTLTETQKELLRQWITEGAKWDTHWAFVPPKRPALPQVDDTRKQPANPIDAFIRERLTREKLAPAAPASREELIRRVTLDLNGLPPTPAEVAAFVGDRSPDAYEKLVDRLLASHRYGERWAWDWLDIARYADTNGFQGDFERNMWPWRDWVVNALNANMPYDQFTIEQIAGDLLPNATTGQKLASGFNRNNMFNGEGGRIFEETRVENVFDRVETTATTWMGLTFSCTRCHDHKFDPLKQTDYFALYDIFNQMSETGKPNGFGITSGKIPPVLDLSSEDVRGPLKEAEAKAEDVGKEIEDLELTKFSRPAGQPVSESPEAKKLPKSLFENYAKVEVPERALGQLNKAYLHFTKTDPDSDYAALIKRQIDALSDKEAILKKSTRVMIMDQLAEPRDTFVLNKGNYASVSAIRVNGHIPEIFQTGQSSERLDRLGLARWLVSPGNPLAARVAVNRAWQAFFGTGFVKTAEDFGVQSERPTHPELLDWLATEFVESGWNVKALHRLIVTSATYQQSSRVTPALHELDPENRLLARGPRYRLPSWMIRDQSLAMAGLLVDKPGGPGVKPYQPAGLWEEASFGKITYQQDHDESLYRRSLYVFWRRIVGPTTFFNSGNRQVCTVKVTTTNTPLHALVTLNDPVYVEAARVMAQRICHEATSDRQRIDLALQLATARRPTSKESAILTSRLEKLRHEYTADPSAARQLIAIGEAPRSSDLEPSEHAAWTSLCLLILNLDETLSLQ